MCNLKKAMATGICLAVGFTLFTSPVMAGNDKNNHHSGPKKTKNIIFMVPDGQGLSNVTAARIFKNGPNGDPLYQETLENIGYQRTHSANSTVTDSAAAASAWAAGEKFINGEISCHGETDGVYENGNPVYTGNCIDNVPTILELAEKMGKATGLVATSQISHATPAAFGAHVFSRNCGVEIARQYIEDAGVDVILGGGVYKASAPSYCDVYKESYAPADRRQYIIDLAVNNGYSYVTDEAEMDMASSHRGSIKVLGMFEQLGEGEGKSVEMFRVDPSVEYPEGEPTLAEMTSAALDILEKDRDGLFLMVEGSQVDWEDHAGNVEGQIAESLGFDAAVKAVLDWVNEKPSRKNDTLIIVVADHETGGFAVNGPYGSLSEAGDIVEDGWTSGNHTAVDTIIYSQGPGSEKLGKALDNTDLYYVMEEVIR